MSVYFMWRPSHAPCSILGVWHGYAAHVICPMVRLGERIAPDPAAAAVYARLYPKYRALKPIFDQLGAL